MSNLYSRKGEGKNEKEAARLYKLAADQGNAEAQYNLALDYANGIGGLAKNEQEAIRLFKLAADQGNSDAESRLADLGQDYSRTNEQDHSAPTSVAQTAYDYLRQHFTSNVGNLIRYKITTSDGNICHLRYSFNAASDAHLQYDLNVADIEPESVRAVSEREGAGWAGIMFNAAPGKQFQTQGSLGPLGRVSPTSTSIKLVAMGKPDDVVLRALVKLAKECGAKQLPF